MAAQPLVKHILEVVAGRRTVLIEVPIVDRVRDCHVYIHLSALAHHSLKRCLYLVEEVGLYLLEGIVDEFRLAHIAFIVFSAGECSRSKIAVCLTLHSAYAQLTLHLVVCICNNRCINGDDDVARQLLHNHCIDVRLALRAHHLIFLRVAQLRYEVTSLVTFLCKLASHLVESVFLCLACVNGFKHSLEVRAFARLQTRHNNDSRVERRCAFLCTCHAPRRRYRHVVMLQVGDKRLHVYRELHRDTHLVAYLLVANGLYLACDVVDVARLREKAIVVVVTLHSNHRRAVLHAFYTSMKQSMKSRLGSQQRSVLLLVGNG